MLQAYDELGPEKLEYVLPTEAFAMYCDNMAIPTTPASPYAAHLFMDYVLDPKVAGADRRLHVVQLAGPGGGAVLQTRSSGTSCPPRRRSRAANGSRTSVSSGQLRRGVEEAEEQAT